MQFASFTVPLIVPFYLTRIVGCGPFAVGVLLAVWGLIASLYIGNALLLILNLPMAGVWVKLLAIPRPWLYGGILVVGVDKLMTGLAKCCKPVPPDPIVGFVTRLKGITIHRADCSNVQRMMASEPNRIIDADWGDAAQNDLFSVQIDVIASDRQGLLRDISDVLAREKINVTAVNTLTRDFVAKMKFTAEVRSMDQLRAALVQVAQVKGVQSARRV